MLKIFFRVPPVMKPLQPISQQPTSFGKCFAYQSCLSSNEYAIRIFDGICRQEIDKFMIKNGKIEIHVEKNMLSITILIAITIDISTTNKNLKKYHIQKLFIDM